MELRFDSEKPIFQQLSDWIADNIIRGAFAEGSQIPSTTEISVTYKVNPATALKAVNILVDKGVIYKKRGLGMFVSEGACEMLIKERQEEFYGSYVKTMLEEAEKLGLTKQDLINMINKA